MKRTLSIPALVLVAVVALVLGTFGSATAAGITKGQVKKIAAKVVASKASSLTVATAQTANTAATATTATTATNAGNAANLAGQPASAYTDNAAVYYTTVSTALNDVEIVIPGLAAGKSYQISYSAFLSGATAGDASCYLYQFNATTATYAADDSSSIASPSMSGVGVVTGAAGFTTELYCNPAGTFTTIPEEPIQIVVTPLDSVTTGTLAGVRASGSRTR